MYTVSIVVPVHNCSKLITKTVRSILEQTYQDFEIIIVDDGSTDNTGEVVRSFDDVRIRYFRHEKNCGVSALRNTGIKYATGKYIAFADADEIWMNNKLEKQVKILEETLPEVGVAYTGSLQISGDKQVYVPFDFIEQKEGYIRKYMLYGNFVIAASALVKKECFDTLGVFDEQMENHSDWDLFIRISQYYQFRFINEVLVYKYVRNDNLSIRDLNKEIKENISVFSKYLLASENKNRILAWNCVYISIYSLLTSKHPYKGMCFLLRAVSACFWDFRLLFYAFITFFFRIRLYSKVREKDLFIQTIYFYKRIPGWIKKCRKRIKNATKRGIKIKKIIRFVLLLLFGQHMYDKIKALRNPDKSDRSFKPPW